MVRSALIGVCLLLCPALALAATPVHVLETVDGDTIRVRVDGNVPGWDVFDVRLIGVNTPEKRSRCDSDEERETEREMAARAENYVRDRIEAARSIGAERILSIERWASCCLTARA